LRGHEQYNIAVGCPDENALSEFALRGPQATGADALEAHIDVCPTCRGVLAQLLQLRSSMGQRTPAAPGSSDETTPLDAAGEQLVATDAFELRREIARGGMGAIYEAWDARHGRRVAVKLLLRADQDARRRFERESRIGARLQHPSIVPVYHAGSSRDGEPFLAMKLVEGRSLGALVAERAGLSQRLSLLSHVIAAAEALAYAHTQGVVHRDLKPANVLVGQFGETVVIDWGLARSDGDAEESLRGDASAHGDAALTAAGTTLGTPSYMPPEQARGEPADARSDVYALGAILYCVLAGGAPYAGRNPHEVLERVRQAGPERLLDRAPDAPAELVAIAERAMERSPERRYPSARELAEDLRRFSDGRLVSAHVYSPGALARRWLRRHRGPVAVGAVALLALATTLALSFRRVERERRTAVTQRDAAEGLARFMVDELRRQLVALGRIELLRGVGAKVDEYYRAVSALEDANAPEALDRRASALETLAEVDVARTDQAAARARLIEAVALRERAAAMKPGDREQRARLVEALVQLGGRETELNKHDAALVVFRRALEVARALAAEDPAGARSQRALAKAQRELAQQLAEHGDVGAALEARKAERDVLVRAAAAAPEDLDLQWELGEAFLYLGQLEVNAFSRVDDALASERQALAVYDRLIAREPDNARWQTAQSNALQMIAALTALRGDVDQALPMFEGCVKTRERLLLRDPADLRMQRRLAYCLEGVIGAYLTLGRAAEAREASLRMLQLQEAAAGHAGSFTAQRDVMHGLRHLGLSLLATADAAGARERLSRGVAIADGLLRQDPSGAGMQWERAAMLVPLARAEFQLRRLEAAEAAARDAVATIEKEISAAQGGRPIAWRVVVEASSLLAEVLAARRDPAGARAAARATGADLDRLVRIDKEHAEWLKCALEATRRSAGVLARAGDATGARELLSATLAALEKVKAEGRLPNRMRAGLEALRAESEQLAAR
jgi:predicted Ser/Thr protein kinase/tetratricopeptide (TPR) repeat protein